MLTLGLGIADEGIGGQRYRYADRQACTAGQERGAAVREDKGECDLKRAKAIIDGVSKDFIVLSGDDPTAVELILLGGKGNISVTANVAPREMADLCEAALKGDAETARAINEKLMPLHKDLFIEANPIPVKWALVEMGLMHEGIRLPLTWLSTPCHETLRSALRQCSVLV